MPNWQRRRRTSSRCQYDDSQPPPPQDPIATDRKRREYESLFASNVVLSRRPENERPDVGRKHVAIQCAGRADGASPSVDEVADAVVRATTPNRRPHLELGSPDSAAGANAFAAVIAFIGVSAELPTKRHRSAQRDLCIACSKGTVIDTVLTNRLDGSSASPVNCLVTNALYSHTGRQVLIPAGARILGETKPVQAFGETRLAVSFHRLLMPDGRTYRLDQFLGLNQIGDAGLRDKVNNHYLSTFGAAAAVGLISGLSQYLGSAGLG